MKKILLSTFLFLPFSCKQANNTPVQIHEAKVVVVVEKKKAPTKPLPMGFKEMLIRVIHSESGDCFQDVWCVAQVLKNRTIQLGKTVEEVINQRGQFSGIGSSLWNISMSNPTAIKIGEIVDSVWAENIPDSLLLPKTTMFFMNPAIAKGQKYFLKMKRVMVTDNGHHYFDNKI